MCEAQTNQKSFPHVRD